MPQSSQARVHEVDTESVDIPDNAPACVASGARNLSFCVDFSTW
jgi:hypothetical protein